MLKKMLMILLTASVRLPGNMDFTIPDSWGKSAEGIRFEQGVVSLPGQSDLVSKSIRFSLFEKYCFSGEVRTEEAESNLPVEVALIPYGKKRILGVHVNPMQGTFARLIKPYTPGDLQLCIDAGEAWQANAWIMPNASEDASDLPNFQAQDTKIESITKTPEGFVVRIGKALEITNVLPAGSGLRQALPSENQLLLFSASQHDGTWKKFQVPLAGISKTGIEEGKFWPGMISSQLRIRCLQSAKQAKKSRVQLRNLKLESVPMHPVIMTDNSITFNSPLVARKDLDVSPLWMPKKFFEHDFYLKMPVVWYEPPEDPEQKQAYDAGLKNFLHYPLENLPPEIRRHVDIPAFRDIIISPGYIALEDVIKNADGTYTFDLQRITARVPEQQPFMLSVQRFTRPYRKETRRFVFLENYSHDQAAYQKWKNAHPNLLAVSSLSEWGNEANNLSRRIAAYVASGELSQEEIKKLQTDWPDNLNSRREFIEKRLKPLVDRHAATWFNDPGSLHALEGAWCFNHLAAYWGVKVLTMETSRSFALWQLQLMFNRGAARQFNRFWGWYAASFLTAYNSKGEWVTDSEPAAFDRVPGRWAPGCGLSQNAIERVYRMAFFSGANFFEREDTDNNFWNPKQSGEERWKPAPEGQMFIDFHTFSRKHPDRGAAYTPVALLVPHDRGSFRTIGKAFRKFRYLKSDHMFDAFIATLYAHCPKMPALKEGIEQTLRNSPYGDIFDILTPDFPDQSSFRGILPAYKVAILIGEYPEHPEMTASLQEYVRHGGTLILNARHLEKNFKADFTGVIPRGISGHDGAYVMEKLELSGASSILSDSNGNALFTSFRYGKGQVIVAAPHWLVPDYDDSGDLGDFVLSDTESGNAHFKYIQALLQQICRETLPVRVQGDIQYGLNKTPTGWWIYLFNNEGIRKFTDTPETFDPARRASVTIDLGTLQAQRIVELISGKTVEFSGNRIDTEVDPGKYQLFQIEL